MRIFCERSLITWESTVRVESDLAKLWKNDYKEMMFCVVDNLRFLSVLLSWQMMFCPFVQWVCEPSRDPSSRYWERYRERSSVTSLHKNTERKIKGSRATHRMKHTHETCIPPSLISPLTNDYTSSSVLARRPLRTSFSSMVSKWQKENQYYLVKWHREHSYTRKAILREANYQTFGVTDNLYPEAH